MKKPIKRKKPVFTFKSAMLVDDNELDNFINQKILESNYFAEKIYINSGGISAIELLKNFMVDKKNANNLMPEVIFIDINMPFMDGFQLIEQILKMSESIVGKCKLVVLTSSINPEDKMKVANISKDVLFLNKPLTDTELALIT